VDSADRQSITPIKIATTITTNPIRNFDRRYCGGEGDGEGALLMAEG